MIGFKALQKGVKEAVLDIGLKTSVKNSSVYAIAAGARDAGLKLPVGSVIPNKDRLSGKHIADYAAKLKKENKAKYDSMFSQYIKNNLDPETISNHVNEVVAKITYQSPI